jgi:hypothetical protein
MHKATQRAKNLFGLVDHMKGGHFAYQKLGGIADIPALTF